MKTTYTYQQETRNAAEKIPLRTVSYQAHQLGIRNAEPVIIALDSMIRYAKAHEAAFGSKLNEDYVLGPLFLSVITGIRGLFDGNGAIANEISATTNKPCRDSKDNSAVEAMFWDALSIAGFKEEDI